MTTPQLVQAPHLRQDGWDNHVSDLPTILVVEDDPVIRALLVEIFSEVFTVLEASSARQALSVVEHAARLPCLALFDYWLPTQEGLAMNGIDLYDQLCLRFGWQRIPTLIVSATIPEKEVKERGLTSVPKPFDIFQLLEKSIALVHVQEPFPRLAGA